MKVSAKVRSRFEYYIGRAVRLRLAWLDSEELIHATIVDVLSGGRDYYVDTRVGCERRVFNLRVVTEIAEVP